MAIQRRPNLAPGGVLAIVISFFSLFLPEKVTYHESKKQNGRDQSFFCGVLYFAFGAGGTRSPRS